MNIMSAVSAQTLFQFTQDLETLEKILESKGFWPKYCLEYGWKQLFAVPECCFCDIPLVAIANHINNYGGYGIGMTKRWGINKGLAPVMYYIKDSEMSKNIVKVLKSIQGENKELVYKQLALTKMYQGENPRICNSNEEYIYYNEREWRYIPSLPDPKLFIKKFKDKASFEMEKQRLNKSTKQYLCTYTASDVKYLIVKDDDDRLSLISSIDGMNNWEQEDKRLLKSKIITHELINDDL